MSWATTRRLYTESLALARQSDYQRGIGSSVGNLGNVAYAPGDYSAARELHEECLSIQRRLGNQRGIASSLNSLGTSADVRGELGLARELHGDAPTIRCRLGDKGGVAASLKGMAQLASRQKQAWKTVKLLGVVSALHESIGIAPAVPSLKSRGDTAALRQEALGAAAFAAASEADRAMTLDEAVKYVLEEYAQEGNME